MPVDYSTARVGWARGIRRGLAMRCPACGERRLFARFLKVADRCDNCGQELHHHRADHLPPYVTIVLVGFVVGHGILVSELYWEWPLWRHIVVWPALTLVLALALMQPIKGAVVGLQYALGMHGFGHPEDRRENEDREREREDRRDR